MVGSEGQERRGLGGETYVNAILLENFVGNGGTSLKSKRLGQHESIVTVKEDVGDGRHGGIDGAVGGVQ
jgi:hypothetical protein